MVGMQAGKTGTLQGLAFATLLLAGGAPMAQQGATDIARLEKLKSSVVEGVESRRKLSQVMNDTVFSFGELAYQELETSNYLTDVLEKNGFPIERGIAGMPTAWVARWGSGSPVIALGSDIDCIPKANQKPGVAYREELVEGAPGHGEGHNSGQAVNIVAALAVKDLMERDRLPGTLVLWPGVAEELLAGKAYMVRAGLFKDIDVVLYTHVGDTFSTAWGQPTGTGLVSVEYTFHGEAAHAAARPWRGRNALRAVELMNIGWDLRREQLRPQQRSHYVITNGGDQPNVIPPVASVWYFIREMDFDNIKRNYEIANKIADAAAMMTDTTVTRKLVGTAAPRHFSRALAEALAANFTKVGIPQWTEEEQTFAKAVQKLTSGDQVGLRHRADPARAAARTARERRLRRHRRRLLGGADRAAVLPVQYSEPARPPLGQCDGDGHAHRPQGQPRRLQGDGHDHGRSAVAPGVGRGGEDLFQRCAAQVAAATVATRRDRPAAGPDQSGYHGALPPGDAQVLLRRLQVRHLSRSARRQVSAADQAAVGWANARRQSAPRLR